MLRLGCKGSGAAGVMLGGAEGDQITMVPVLVTQTMKKKMYLFFRILNLIWTVGTTAFSKSGQ